MSLGDQIHCSGSVVDQELTSRTWDNLVADATDETDLAVIAQAWPVLGPVFSASPYLAGLAGRSSSRLARLLAAEPALTLQALLSATKALIGEPDPEQVRIELRRLKSELHLVTALADLGGVWTLDQVTGALSGFADLAVEAALWASARVEQARGALRRPEAGEAGPIPGLFCLALGKHGAFELNYSSDIDISVFYTPERLPATDGCDPHALAVRLTQGFAAMMQARTADGYVFRTDLRLRPDPSSTPIALPVEAALLYYESAGQNWERAAMIKARACAGDLAAARAFLQDLQPFIWRRNLDFAAIADIHAIKRQIHVYKVDERLSAPGHNLKLGAGGIREIEFFVQTQQLILGGRDGRLRAPRTVDALLALNRAGHVPDETANLLIEAYVELRRLEHRVQMIADEQSHTLPESDAARWPIAALAGFETLAEFDLALGGLLRAVNARYGELFAEDEPLSSDFGSLVFTGVDDDPETLTTLDSMGFSSPSQVSQTIRRWHHGRIGPTRTARGRELFTRLAPRLLSAACASGAPDLAFNRFSDFFSALPSGVQIQSLFLAQPKLFELVVEVMAYAPQLAATLARQPGALDALLDAQFFQPIDASEAAMGLSTAVEGAPNFEAAMSAARRAHREQAFRIGVQVMSGVADADRAGEAFAALADACICALAPRALVETERLGGAFPGHIAVVALGKTGSREMTAASDLDLMTLYMSETPGGASAIKGWEAETFYTRFTQRLITALSAPTADGGLYTVDLQLRPSGRAGPVAVSLPAFDLYYTGEAETWEAMALTRARVVWASSETFAKVAATALDQALRRARDPEQTLQDARDMRDLMRRERPPAHAWDLKLAPGGLVDIEFAAQALQLRHATSGGPLRARTRDALEALAEAGLGDCQSLNALAQAWRLQQNLSQVLKIALGEPGDPRAEPEHLKALLARAGGDEDFARLQQRLDQAQANAFSAYKSLIRN